MKALVQLLGAALAAVLPLLTATDTLSLTEWINVGVVAAGALSVYIATNLPAEPVWNYSKLAMSALSAAGVVLISALSDSVVGNAEVWQIVAAVLAALGVWGAPAASSAPAQHRAA